jgi:gliding motility-associated-like protein
LTSASGCDSVATLQLLVDEVVKSTTSVFVCPSQLPYTWNGQTFTSEGTYNVTLTSVSGCDSIATLILSLNPVLTSTTNASICTNQLPYSWSGQSYNAAGSYIVNLKSTSGCDSVATLNLEVLNTLKTTTNVSVCENQLPYTWNGQTYNSAGTYTVTLKSASGCDSVVTLVLAVNSTTISTTPVTVCQNQLPYSWNGQTYNAAGTYNIALKSSGGCDSVATLVLVVNSSLASDTTIAVCSSQLPYTWNGQTFNAAGTYTATFKATLGCDSVATLHLSIKPITTSTESQTVCSNQLPYSWNGQSYTQAGTYTDTLLNAAGCDSIATLKLSVSTSLTSTTDLSICEKQLPYTWNGQSYNSAGTYTVTLTSVAGCDSIATLNLAVNSTVSSITNATICEKQLPYSWNSQSITAAGTYQVTLKNIAGCDSIASLVLVVNSNIASTANKAICSNELPYSWNGQSYTAAGNYTVTLTSASGCDSIATLNLVVNDVLSSIENVSVCESKLPYTWNGQPYSDAGMYKLTFKSSAGCDSTVTLNLAVKPAVSSTNTVSVCSNQLPYSWNGQTYTAAGTYKVTLTSVYGCDSVATLDLTVVQTIKGTVDSTTVCANILPYQWNSITISSPGTYTTTLQSAGGCDSVATLVVTTTPVATAKVTGGNPICTGSSTTISISLTGTAPWTLVYSDGTATHTISGIMTSPYTMTVSPVVTTTYTLQSVSDVKCFNTSLNSSVTVTVTQSTLPGMRYSNVTATPNVAKQLSARDMGNGYTYSWAPPVGLNFTDIRTPVFRYDRSVEYLITLSTGNGCKIVDTLRVLVTSSAPAIRSSLHVPNSWSPNNDGHNDKLFPLTINMKELYYFRIFNRWGQLMFETNKLNEGWDGMFNGKPQIQDVYTWTVEAIGLDGVHYKQSGNSILLR